MEQPQASAQSGTSPGAWAWLLDRLDGLLSEPLRGGTPSERLRHRVMVGAAAVLLFLSLLGGVLLPRSGLTAVEVLWGLGALGTLVLARRTASVTAPASLLCGSLALGSAVSTVFLSSAPYSSMHAWHMLLPAFAVYLLGARQGFVLTLCLLTSLGVLSPFYQAHVIAHPVFSLDPYFLPMQVLAALALLGAWGLSTLHATARVDAQAMLEQALKKLHESEGELHSLLESSDDLICSLDTEGRLLIANSAVKKDYLRAFGQEAVVGQPLIPPRGVELAERWRQRLAKVLEHQRVEFEDEFEIDGKWYTLDIRANPIVAEGNRITGITLVARDITARKRAELRLGEMHRTLVDVSRQAGMAEVATGVLHNVGNTLNSVNVSVSLVTEKLRNLRVSPLSRIVELLTTQAADLGSFFTQDPRGKQLPAYLQAIAQQLSEEQEALLKEMGSLSTSVEHIKSIVSMQQQHARSGGSVEQLPVPQLIDEAMRLHSLSLERLGIRIERDYAHVPPILVDRHKLLQILMNLLSNARHALVESLRPDKVLTLRVRRTPDGQRLLIEVSDNGVGIEPENLPRLFTQGFTTKPNGHGFGLHISALAASEMKGRLSGTSPGPDQGATFTLELPLVNEQPLPRVL